MKIIDKITEQIISIISNSNEPLTTQEISRSIEKNRIFTFYHLTKLALMNKIRGKQPKNYGSWIWWIPIPPTNSDEKLSIRKKELEQEFSKLRDNLTNLKEDEDDTEINRITEKNEELESEIKEKEEIIKEMESNDTEISKLKGRINFLVSMIYDIKEKYLEKENKDITDFRDYMWENWTINWGMLKKYF